MAVRFNASGQEYTRTLTLGAISQVSVACWMKISVDRNDTSTVWSLDDGNASGFNNAYLATDTDGTSIRFIQSSASSWGGRALTVGTWYYVAVSVNGANGTMISRALADTSFTVTTWSTGAATVNAANWRIGKPVYSDRWLNGSVAAVKMWQATLTQAELEAEAWEYMPQRTANLGLWHPMVRPETVDYSGQGRTLSGGGGVATEDGPGISWRQGRRRMLTPLSVPAEATPGPVDGAWTVPAPAVSLGAETHPALIEGTWQVPTPSVYTGDPVTPVDPPTVQADWSVPQPVAEAFKNVTVTPTPVEASWSVPAPSAVVPVNPGDDLDGPLQVSFNGFKLGGLTRYQGVRLFGVGVDLPEIDNGNVDNPSSDGAMSGRKTSRPRVIEYLMNIRSSRDEIEQVAQDLLDGMPLPEADEEMWLAVRVGEAIRIARGAVTGRGAPIETNWKEGFVPASIQWTCSDPRLYSRELNSATVGDGQTVAVYNAGNRNTRPLVRCPGPANGPELVLEQTLADGTEIMRSIGFDLEVGADETLVIDPASGTATIGETPKRRFLTNDSNVGIPDWVLGRETSYITYTTEDGTAPAAVVLWRHAWI